MGAHMSPPFKVNGNKPTNRSSMDILTQPNGHLRLESETFFDKRSRENYFAKMKVALKNLSIVDRKSSKIKI